MKDLWARERIYISFRTKGREGVVEKVVEDLRIPRRIVTDKDYFQAKNEEIRRCVGFRGRAFCLSLSLMCVSGAGG